MKRAVIRIIGLDPGLRHTGWGLVELAGNQLRPVDCGVISGGVEAPMAERLQHLHDELTQVLRDLRPDEAAVEEILSIAIRPRPKTGHGTRRDHVGSGPAWHYDIGICSYRGQKDRDRQRPSRQDAGSVHGDPVVAGPAQYRLKDASDALAVAICHAHHRRSKEWG